MSGFPEDILAIAHALSIGWDKRESQVYAIAGVLLGERERSAQVADERAQALWKRSAEAGIEAKTAEDSIVSSILNGKADTAASIAEAIRAGVNLNRT